MIRPREIRRQRRQQHCVDECVRHPLMIVGPAEPLQVVLNLDGWRDPYAVTSEQLAAAEALREERDLLCLGAPSDGELWAVMSKARP